MDGRSARKDANRRLVVDAAFRLFQEGGEAALTMRRLASEAGVSEATPYNLFGNKTGVLVAMFEDFLANLPGPGAPSGDEDPLRDFFHVTDSVARLWSDPSGLFCGLMAAIMQSGDVPSELIDRPRRGIGGAIQRLQAAGWVRDSIPAGAVADRIAHANAGLFSIWQSGQLTPEELSIELRLNALLPILGAATDDKRPLLSASLEEQLTAHQQATQKKG